MRIDKPQDSGANKHKSKGGSKIVKEKTSLCEAIELAIEEKESRNGPATQGEDKIAGKKNRLFLDGIGIAMYNYLLLD